MTIETGDSVTIEYTGRMDDGSVFDTTHESVAVDAGLDEDGSDREYSPLTVEIGAGEIIEGLEEALIGMDEGETATVELPPEKAYQWSEDNIRRFPRAQFVQTIGQEPEEGAYIRSKNGGVGEITSVDEERVEIDFNHELAGETIEFEFEVVDVS
ncbi:peptidylprolyl isomerase [Halalkaliarchaeum desulfuricum]|uniref:Peptidyl-prolyl cis-trans isomerase n=1 Tax=Halalkaliarchaeum desulfuricum TaxID=2055893 RepID=A0A343TLT2_9EURY|nr:peptidylprolyl isomerase [Halalkaliarchaeum desulfuricum]AUX10054.1 peptidylprolyl isomerase [Halalkaliarchaeum desulfuricum]